MAKSINKFIVKLADQSSFKPQLAVAVTAIKEVKNKYLVKLLHPNTKEIVYSEEFTAVEKDNIKAAMAALSYGKTLLDKPEVQNIQSGIEYKEQLFIPQGKRGKMKLKTKEAAELDKKELDLVKEMDENFEELEDLEVLEENLDEMEIEEFEEKIVIEEEDIEISLPKKIKKPKKDIKNKKKIVKKEIKNKKPKKKIEAKKKNKKRKK